MKAELPAHKEEHTRVDNVDQAVVGLKGPLRSLGGRLSTALREL